MLNREEMLEQFFQMVSSYERVLEARKTVGTIAEQQFNALPPLLGRNGYKFSFVVFDPGTYIKGSKSTIYPDIIAAEGSIYIAAHHTSARTFDSRSVTLFYHKKDPEMYHTAEIRPNGNYTLDGKSHVMANVGLPLPFMATKNREKRIFDLAHKALVGVQVASVIERAGSIAVAQANKGIR